MLTSNNKYKMISIRYKYLMLIVCGLGIILISACGSTNQPTNSGTSVPVSFSQEVAPIFDQRCIQCHSGLQASGQLDLSSYSGVMAGSARGAVVTPGDAGKSKLISLVSSGQMPKSGAKLTADQITILENWINSGAKEN